MLHEFVLMGGITVNQPNEASSRKTRQEIHNARKEGLKSDYNLISNVKQSSITSGSIFLHPTRHSQTSCSF